MRVGIHTQYFPPEIGAPQNRLASLAQALVKNGHEVFVLTAMPNYPAGKIHTGYGGLFQKEEIDRAVVLRCAIFPTNSLNIFLRLTNYFSFVLSSFVIGSFTLPKLDILLTESPPLFLGLSGYLLSRIKRAKWVFNVSDLWPASAVQLGIVRDGWKLKAAYALEEFCYKKADLVSCQSLGIMTDIQRRFPEVKTYHLSNGVDFAGFNAPRVHSSNRCRAIYAGLHGRAQGLDQVLDAAGLVSPEKICLDFIGDGPDKKELIKSAEKRKLSNVRFLDALPLPQVRQEIMKADIAIVPLKETIPGAVPSKLYEAMAAGLPVLLIAGGEPAEIVARHGCGISVKPGSPKSIAEALSYLADNKEARDRMGKAGRKAVAEYYDRGKIADQFTIFLKETFGV